MWTCKVRGAMRTGWADRTIHRVQSLSAGGSGPEKAHRTIADRKRGCWYNRVIDFHLSRLFRELASVTVL